MKSENLRRIHLLFNTVKYLKTEQMYYRVFYTIRNRLRKIGATENVFSIPSAGIQLMLCESLPSNSSFEENKFTFLNTSHYFKNKIDWNCSKYGKLWTYNLTYFDCLQQKDITQDAGLMLVNDFIDQSASITDGLMPFPISLRGINWIKFLTKYKVKDQKINDSLYAQYFKLMDNVEYNILGNHLLENGFSLLFGAYYFQNEKFYAKAKKILTDELDEQILKDGAHFELSPMYHQIMLFRVLDCINLVQNNNYKENELLLFLEEKAQIMLNWLNTITFGNGSIPLFNDSTNNIAPTTEQLNHYAITLNSKFKIQNSKLSASGYRKVRNDNYEIIMDVGDIGPDYIPGHVHSDTFNFELHVQNQPVIVDTGLSTYEPNDRRQLERSTKSHNTVEIDGENQSQVWGGFRVAKRAKIVDLKESNGRIEATHDGYKYKGILHTRKFIIEKDQIIIKDSLGTKKEHLCIAYLHFHPDIKIHIDAENLICELLTISSINSNSMELIDFDYSPEFNKKIKAQCVKVSFINELETKIKIKNLEDMNANN